MNFPLLRLAIVPLLAAAAPLAATAAKTDAPAAEPDVIATVNGEPIRLAQVENLLERIHTGAHETSRPDFDVDRLLFRLVNDALLSQEARAAGIDEEPEIRRKVAEFREQLALGELERREFTDKAEPTDDEIAAAYRQEYRKVTLRVVSAYDRDGADALLAALRDGADMDALAREKSVDPIAIRGGLMKPAPRLDLQSEVGDVAFSLEPGQLGGPIETPLGWSVIRVESFEEPDPAGLADVRERLRQVLRHQRVAELRQGLAARAAGRYPVRIDEAVRDAIRPEPQPDARLIPTIADPDAVVARIGKDRTITARAYGAELLARWKGVRNAEAAVAAAPIVLDGMVRRELLTAEALDRGYGKLPETERSVAAYEESLLIPRFLEEVVAANITIEPAEIRAYYDEHEQQFLRPPRVRLGQITVADTQTAQRIAGELRAGADLAWLAKQQSTDRLKDSGGDRGWYEPVPGVDPFNDWLLTAQPGDVGDPSGPPGNVTVVKVLAREEQGPYPFEQISGNVREALFADRFRQALDAVVTKLRERSDIRVFEDRVSRLQIRGSFDPSKTEGDGGAHAH